MDPILRNDPFSVDVAYDANTINVTLLQDGNVVGAKPVNPPGVAGTVSFPYPSGLVPGTYNFTATASGIDGVSPMSDVYTLVVGGRLPAAPSSITFRFGV